MSRPFDPEEHLEAVAAMVGLTIAPEHREGVKLFLSIAAGMANTLDSVPLDKDAALAPVYTPPETDR